MRANQYRQSIKKGHLALIWKAREDAGIYAIGRIECDPQLMKEDGLEDKFWLENNEKEEMIRVRIIILNNMVIKPILKGTLKQYSELKDLSILKFQQGTNFPVRDSEWKIISKLID